MHGLTRSFKNKQSSVEDARLTVLDELKQRFSRPSNRGLSTEDNAQRERSIGSTFIDNPISYQKLQATPPMNDSIISNTTTDISELDSDHNDRLVSEIELVNENAIHDGGDKATNAHHSFNSRLENDESWLVKDRPALKSLWEQLMKERNEHHKTAYTLETLQAMYYNELQKNAHLQNTIDKLRFSEGSSCQNSRPQFEQNIMKPRRTEDAFGLTMLKKLKENSTSSTVSKEAVIVHKKLMVKDEIASCDYSSLTDPLTNSEPSSQMPSQLLSHEVDLPQVSEDHIEYFPEKSVSYEVDLNIKDVLQAELDLNVQTPHRDTPNLRNGHDEFQNIIHSPDTINISKTLLRPFPSKESHRDHEGRGKSISYRKDVDKTPHKSKEKLSHDRLIDATDSQMNASRLQLKSAVKFYESLDFAYRQSSMLQKRSKEMLLYLIHSDEA